MATRLQLPRIKPGTLCRPRLADLVVNHLDRKLVMITADAGYGKTTLMAQIREQALLPHVYLALEPEDSDFASFYSLLLAGVRRLQPGLAPRSAALAAEGTGIAGDQRLAMGTLINELVEQRNEELFFLIDDYHALTVDSPVHRAMDYFIDRLPDMAHVLLASRAEPPLPSLPKWRAKRDVFDLPAGALRFDEQEIGALLTEGYRQHASVGESKNISIITEGWITAIHLILQAAARDGKTIAEVVARHQGGGQDLFRYFAGEVYQREQSENRMFLCRSSVLETMTPEACRHVLQDDSARERLRDLEQRHLLLAVTGEGEYRYHRLFREFLYGQISDHSERHQLHRRAAQYFLHSGKEEKAIDHFLAAEDYRAAAELIARVRERVINRAQLSLVRKWLEKFPEESLAGFPWLYGIRAVLHKEQGKLAQAEECYQRAEAAMKNGAAPPAAMSPMLYEKGIVQHRQGEYRAALATLKSALASCRERDLDIKISILGFTAQVLLEGLGDTRRARRYLGRARALLKNSVNAAQSILIEQKDAVLLESLGEKRRAFKVYARIIDRIGDQYTHLVGSYFHNAAKVALDLGKSAWAEECLNRGWSLCREYEDVFSRSMLEFGFGYLHLFQGQWDAAQKHLETARRIFEEMNWSRSVCIALRQQARLERYRGNQQQAMALLGLMKQVAPGQLDQMAVLLEQTLVEAARKDYPAAKEALDACREKAVKYFGHMGEIVCALATAEINAGTGHRKEAVTALRQAVGLCRDFGFDGLLSCELRASPPLAEMSKALKDEADYLLSIPSYTTEHPQPLHRERLSVSLFGPPRVKIDDREVAILFRPQTLRLLSFLAHRGVRGAARDEILEALWPKSGARQAVGSFHLALHELRQSLRKPLGKRSAAAVLKTVGHYRIDPELGMTVDAIEFDRLLEQARIAENGGDGAAARKLLGRAISLHAAPFCSGWADEWVVAQARLYNDRFLKALLKLGFLSGKAGELETGRDYYEKALSLDPLCEEACRGLLRVYGSMGSISRAEKIYHEHARKLKRDLGIGPSKETVDLHETIMRHAP